MALVGPFLALLGPFSSAFSGGASADGRHWPPSMATCAAVTTCPSPSSALYLHAKLQLGPAQVPAHGFISRRNAVAHFLAAALMTAPAGSPLLSASVCPFSLGAMLAMSHAFVSGCGAGCATFVSGARLRWKGWASGLVASGFKNWGCFVLLMTSRGGGKSKVLGPACQTLHALSRYTGFCSAGPARAFILQAVLRGRTRGFFVPVCQPLLSLSPSSHCAILTAVQGAQLSGPSSALT